MSVLNDPNLERLLASLHATSGEQIQALIKTRAWELDPSLGESEIAARRKILVSDKLFALDQDKAELCYHLCRAINARRIVEIGTSYGVSTLYLAAAVRDNIAAHGGDGNVIGTEYEAGKAAAARRHFADAGLSDLIELREGDLRETLSTLQGPIDFLLVDIWPELARPAIERVAPHLRDGAFVVCDNTTDYRADYADYFAFLAAPANGFRTLTLPYKGGLELSVHRSFGRVVDATFRQR